MQCSVTVTVEVGAQDGIDALEERILQAGREAMRAALAAAVRVQEEQHGQCPRCGEGTPVRSHGTVRRVVLARFGRVEVNLRRRRCLGCGRQFRPAAACLSEVKGANVTRELAAVCALAGASWAYATAARVLHTLGGAQISAEEVRRLTIAAGAAEAQRHVREAGRLVAPTSADIRAERERDPQRAEPPVERLVAGMDGGWVPSREQAGGMEGKVGVVSTGVEAVGKHGRHRLVPRRLVATFGTSEQLGLLSYAAAVRLGAMGAEQEAREQLVLGDGAAWIKAQADLHFPDARRILDWAHVARALHQAIRAALPGRANRARRRELHGRIPDLLWHGDVDGTLAALSALRPTTASPASGDPVEPVTRLEETIGYIAAQRAWLGDYAAWQAAGYPVGSGLIERAVFVVINRRMKRQGMRWCRTNADAIVALRTRELNADADPFDEHPGLPLAA